MSRNGAAKLDVEWSLSNLASNQQIYGKPTILIVSFWSIFGHKLWLALQPVKDCWLLIRYSQVLGNILNQGLDNQIPPAELSMNCFVSYGTRYTIIFSSFLSYFTSETPVWITFRKRSRPINDSQVGRVDRDLRRVGLLTFRSKSHYFICLSCSIIWLSLW